MMKANVAELHECLNTILLSGNELYINAITATLATFRDGVVDSRILEERLSALEETAKKRRRPEHAKD